MASELKIQTIIKRVIEIRVEEVEAKLQNLIISFIFHVKNWHYQVWEVTLLSVIYQHVLKVNMEKMESSNLNHYGDK